MDLVGGFSPYPSEKYESGEIVVPNIWKNKNRSKPPTRKTCSLQITGRFANEAFQSA